MTTARTCTVSNLVTGTRSARTIEFTGSPRGIEPGARG